LTRLRQLLGEPAFKSFFARYAPAVAATLFFLMLGKVCTVGLSWFVKNLVDLLSADHAFSVNDPFLMVVSLLIGYGVALIGSVGFNELKQMLATKMTLRFIQEIAEHTFSHILRLPFNFFLGQKSGVITRNYERGLRGVQVLSELLLYSIFPTVVELVIIVIYVANNYQGWIMSAVSISALLHVIITLKISGRWSVFRERYNNAESHCNQRLTDCLINIESVKLFGNEDIETKRFVSNFNDYRQAFLASQKYCAYLNTSQQFILSLAVVLVLWLGYQDVQAGLISVGDLVMLNALLLQVYSPLNLLGIFYKDVRQSLVDINALVQLSTLPTEKHSGTLIPKEPSSPHITFDKVRLNYGQTAILSEVSFDIKPYTFNAIVGSSGSGKSSLVKLLTRLVEINSGCIRLGTKDIQQIDITHLRALMGVVPQDNTLFNTTIYDNIRYGRLNADMTDVIAAANLADIHDFIMTLPGLYDTEMGERGLKLSGGQRQRIVIARALLRQPSILILDEGTAALDTATEKTVLDKIHATKSKTIIMIAHRLTNVVSADQIIVLDKGRVVGMGSHVDLLTNNPVYKHLWEKHN